MPNSTPLISIGMPVRNNESTLKLAVQSILNQTYPNWELLLINDASVDNTLQVARSFDDGRIRTFSGDRNLGLAARLNQAIYQARGDYFARMDGDDVSYPERLQTQIEFLHRHPEVDLIGAEMLLFGQDGTVVGKRAAPPSHEAICAQPTAGFGLAHPTFLGKIAFFKKYKYRVSSIRAQDQDLLQRSYLHSRFANIPEILYGMNEQLRLKKVLTARMHIAQNFSKEFWRRGRPDLAVKAAAGQAAKGVVDVIAIGSGLNYRILRHRARPVTPVERKKWEQVWAQLTGSGDL